MYVQVEKFLRYPKVSKTQAKPSNLFTIATGFTHASIQHFGHICTMDMPNVSKVVVNESLSKLVPSRLILCSFLIQETLLAVVHVIYCLLVDHDQLTNNV